jgi:hypothetical protein
MGTPDSAPSVSAVGEDWNPIELAAERTENQRVNQVRIRMFIIRVAVEQLLRDVICHLSSDVFFVHFVIYFVSAAML